MLYLGVLDDKSLEYPFGKSEAIRQISDEYLIHQCLMNEKVVLEEGFLLASSEAQDPENCSHVLLEAIKAGVVKIASRHGDFHSYIRERRHFGHKVPPDMECCKSYVEELQRACFDHNAFLNYGPDSLDGDTFASYLALLGRDDFNARLEAGFIQMPKHYKEKFYDAYRYGNKGGQWTARSAWEATAKAMFPMESDVVRALMVVANRERQILRGAAIAHANPDPAKCKDIEVETGFMDLQNSLVRSNVSGPSQRRPDKNVSIYPKLNAAVLRRGYKDIFFDLVNGVNLKGQKAIYLEAFKNYENVPSDHNLKEVTKAVKKYEDEIYSSAKAKSFEEDLISVGFDFAGGTAVGKVVDSFNVHIEKALDFKNKRIESHPGERRGRITRRGVFVAVAALTSFAGFEVSGASKSVASSIRQYTEHDTAFDPDIVDDLPGSSHQRLRIDKARADIFFRKK
jgi:hypothetical protein